MSVKSQWSMPKEAAYAILGIQFGGTVFKKYLSTFFFLLIPISGRHT